MHRSLLVSNQLFLSAINSSRFRNAEDLPAFISEVIDVQSMLLVVWFFALFFVFLIAGTKLLLTFRSNYKEFYKEFKCLLWITTAVLTLPLAVRAICDLLTGFRTWNTYWSSTSKKLTSYNMLFFLFTTYIPIIGQTFSLLFGFMRLIKKESRQLPV